MERPSINLNWDYERIVTQAYTACSPLRGCFSLQEFVCSNIYKSNHKPCQKFSLIEYRVHFTVLLINMVNPCYSFLKISC